MSDKKMYLLTGGNGVLGTELQKHLDCFVPDRSLLNVTWPAVEIADEINTHFKLYNCKGIIHCAAYTDVPGAEINKEIAVETNIIGTRNIAELGRTCNIRVIYISTDYVYPGHVGNYKETDKTEPFNFYGFTKLAGETFMSLYRDLIVRTSFKPNDLWETKYNKAFIDLYTSADYVDIVASEIALVIDSKLTGTINVATEKKSIYELAQKRYPNVGEMSRWEVSKWLTMPSDISMNIDKFKEFKKSLENNDDK